MIHPWIIEELRKQEEIRRQKEQEDKRIYLPIPQCEKEEYKRKAPKEQRTVVINL